MIVWNSVLVIFKIHDFCMQNWLQIIFNPLDLVRFLYFVCLTKKLKVISILNYCMKFLQIILDHLWLDWIFSSLQRPQESRYLTSFLISSSIFKLIFLLILMNIMIILMFIKLGFSIIIPKHNYSQRLRGKQGNNSKLVQWLYNDLSQSPSSSC